MANLNVKASWTDADVLHLARRAGFGLSPEQAAAFRAAHATPAEGVDAWVDGTGIDRSAFLSALAVADPVTEPGRDSAGGAGDVDVVDVPGPHAYLVGGQHAWRNSLSRAQAFLAFRMQYDPHPFPERMALFWHNLFATGQNKVDNVALMLNQWDMLRDHGLDVFDDLVVRVSKDPAMAVWLDSVRNNARPGRTPNENYAREVLELYSLGVDNGYNQNDITELAVALAGWSFTVAPEDVVLNPSNRDDRWVARGTFVVYDGSLTPAGHLRWDFGENANLPQMRNDDLALTFLGETFTGLGTPPAGEAKGERLLRRITALRGTQSATFLAKRLLTHFVTAQFTAADVNDLAQEILLRGFDMRAVLKTLLKSEYFFDANNRWALVEGPVSWAVRQARALGYELASAAGTPARFPAWALATPSFDAMGMKLLDPNGPNGWKEDMNWLNSNTVRYRTRFAAAVALAETSSSDGVTYTLFPSDPAAWFTSPPASAAEVMARLLALTQVGSVPIGVRSSWQEALWPSGAWGGWDAEDQRKARTLAFLVLCSPAGQLY